LIPPFSNRCPPNNVSQAASHPITIDCFRGYPLAHNKPEAGVVESIRNRAQHQQWMGSRYTALAEGKEFAFTTESLVLL
jgi:hypothetical protein